MIAAGESAALFEVGGEHALAVLHQPARAARLGVLVVVGGPQYRVGSHRQFVLLARALAAAGVPVLRFDFRGCGDAEGEARGFADIGRDIGAAIDHFVHMAGVERVVLWGLCDGASAALLYCHATQDARVRGLCLLNPWVRSQASLARAHVKHYYTDRLKQKEFWAKLLSGKVAGTAIQGLWRNLRDMRAGAGEGGVAHDLPFQQRMAIAWKRFQGPIMLGLSGNDYTAKEFLEYTSADPAWSGLLDLPQVFRCDMPGVDHTFSNAAAKAQLQEATLSWLREHVTG